MAASLRVGMYSSHLPQPGEKPGGVDVFVDRLASALVARGHEVTVMTYGPNLVERPYTVTSWSPSTANRSQLTRKFLASWLFNCRRVHGFDVLHLHGDDWFYFRRRVPTVRTFYGTALLEALTATSVRRIANQSVTFLLELLAARLATARYAVGADARWLYQTDGILDCGIEGPDVPARPASDPLIAFVGTWAGRKRGSLLHEVFQREVLPRLAGAQLVMVSDYCEPGPNVTWLPAPSDAEITDMLLRAWVFCLPSTYEGFGIPYLEAMACGVPVVTTPNPGAEHVLGREPAGVIVEDAELGSALVSLLRSDESRRQLAEAGLRRAADFSWDRVCIDHEHAYDEAIARWRARSTMVA